jgi:short-subunit dehydrogenase
MDFKNKTALITGASSGIGAAFARELAGKGANLILVARRLDRLNKLSAELSEKYGVRVEVIGLDLTGDSSVSSLKRKVDDLGVEVDLLVNNAGFATSGGFEAENLSRALNEIDLNVKALVSLTHAFIPGMLSRNDGAVINVASTAAFQPVPTMAVYGATKAFVLSFSEALWAEFEDRGVRVLALCPGGTETEFFEVAGSQGTGSERQSPDRVAKVAIAELSGKKMKPSVVSGSRNKVLAFMPRLVSRAMMSKLAKKAMTQTQEA